MKKTIVLFALIAQNLCAITVQQAEKLQAQFEKVGIYDVNNHDLYNEAEAASIITELNKSSTFRSWAKNLRTAQLESLQQRTATPTPKAPTKDPSLQKAFTALRQENKRLKQENAQLKKRAPAKPPTGELQKLRAENQRCRTAYQNLHKQCTDIVNRCNNLRQRNTAMANAAQQLLTAHNNNTVSINAAAQLLKDGNTEGALNPINQAVQNIEQMQNAYNQLQALKAPNK